VMFRLLNVVRVPHVRKVMLEDMDRELNRLQIKLKAQEMKHAQENEYLASVHSQEEKESNDSEEIIQVAS
jgi:hypothetical protein